MTTNAFNRGTYVDMIIETDGEMGDVQVVGVGLKAGVIARLKSALVSHHWFVVFISVVDFQKKDAAEHHFSCNHWLGYDDGELTISAKTCKSVIATCK